MNTNLRRDAFRALLERQECARPALVFDPLSARMAEDLGFRCAMIPGSDVALSVLGSPDIALITMSEFVDQVHRITRATTLPCVADGDHGYGNAINVGRFVAELETVGLCAVTIEDTDLPAAFGQARNQLVSIDEACGKLRAAIAGRTDPRFAVVGRCNMPLAAGGLDEAVARLQAYEKAGCDALFVAGVKTRDQLHALTSAVALPFVMPTPGADFDDELYLASRRVRVAFPRGTKAMAAAMVAAHGALASVRPAGEKPTESASDMTRRLTRANNFDKAKRDFLQVNSEQTGS